MRRDSGTLPSRVRRLLPQFRPFKREPDKTAQRDRNGPFVCWSTPHQPNTLVEHVLASRGSYVKRRMLVTLTLRCIMKFGPKLVIALSATVVVLGGVARRAQADEVPSGGQSFSTTSCWDDPYAMCSYYINMFGCQWDGTGAYCVNTGSGWTLYCWYGYC
jgi:hypothetical protein